MKTETLQVYGMVCYACTEILENVVKQVPGVKEAEASYMLDMLTVKYEEAETEPARICEAAMKAGYRLERTEGDYETQKKWRQLRQERKKDLRKKIFMVFLCSLTLNACKTILPKPATLLLATVVQIVAVKEFYKDAGNSVMQRKGNMSLLIALGTTLGYLYSLCGLFLSPAYGVEPCFENLSAIITMVLIGRFIELGSRVESMGQIRHLLYARSERANLLQAGEVISVPLEELREGSRFLIRRGEKVPVDGKITEGSVSLDESVVTGEYLPVDRGVGETVTGASLVVRGYAVCEADREWSQSFYYRLMEDAVTAMSGKKIAAITKVDRLMAYFVPLVLLLATVTLFLWYGFLQPGEIQKAMQCGLAVLLVACPCAMSLAVPLSVVYTIGCAAGHGIFIREEGGLEQIGKLKRIVFDKTGTLTTGEINVKRFGCAQGDFGELAGILHEVEKYSVHPVAKAIVSFTESHQTEGGSYKIRDFRDQKGGISAQAEDQTVLAGSREFVEGHRGKPLREEIPCGPGIIVFAVGDAEGWFELEDRIREDAKETVEQLRKLGLTPAILSGDGMQNLKEISETLAMDEVYGKLLPDEKEAVVAEWEKEQGVIMVGDGVNDLPAAIKAKVGIAMGGGCEALKEYADMIIGSNQLRKIPGLISLSRAMNQNIHQNLLWAMAYNIIGIIMAAAGILSPLSAGFAMSLSSAAVVWNAGRMRKKGNRILEKF